MDKIPKTIKEQLPETVGGLREFIKLSQKESIKIHKRIQAAEFLLREKEGK